VIGFILFGACCIHRRRAVLQRPRAVAGGRLSRRGGEGVDLRLGLHGLDVGQSVISNVLTTGAVSIPAMKKTGFTARYAAATEACASTGGVLMPPIMGATAFVMASWLSRPYVEIMLAAAIPSILFYFGLFAQIDAYAARRGLRGLPGGRAAPGLADAEGGLALRRGLCAADLPDGRLPLARPPRPSTPRCCCWRSTSRCPRTALAGGLLDMIVGSGAAWRS
jgi:TRAP-type uncharacterized transport system fused permease subunit